MTLSTDSLSLFDYLIFSFINFWPYFLLSGVSCPYMYMSFVFVMSVSSWKQTEQLRIQL